MAERSSTISGALLLAPTLCIVALRFGLTRINEVISNDIIIEFSIHPHCTYCRFGNVF